MTTQSEGAPAAVARRVRRLVTRLGFMPTRPRTIRNVRKRERRKGPGLRARDRFAYRRDEGATEKEQQKQIHDQQMQLQAEEAAIRGLKSDVESARESLKRVQAQLAGQAMMVAAK
jgi:hypothetical protein